MLRHLVLLLSKRKVLKKSSVITHVGIIFKKFFFETMVFQASQRSTGNSKEIQLKVREKPFQSKVSFIKKELKHVSDAS